MIHPFSMCRKTAAVDLIFVLRILSWLTLVAGKLKSLNKASRNLCCDRGTCSLSFNTPTQSSIPFNNLICNILFILVLKSAFIEMAVFPHVHLVVNITLSKFTSTREFSSIWHNLHFKLFLFVHSVRF